jgi:hypothetical protein
MSTTHARRGQTAIFLLSNTAKTSRVFTLGDVTLKTHKGTGFAVTLAHNQQKRVLMYLDYRGPLPASVVAAGKKKVVGAFFVT